MLEKAPHSAPSCMAKAINRNKEVVLMCLLLACNSWSSQGSKHQHLIAPT